MMAVPKGPSVQVATVWLIVARQKRAERILDLRAQGVTWDEIAEVVGLSTVRVRQIYKKEVSLKELVRKHRERMGDM